MAKTVRAAIYLRVSTSNQTVENQRRELEAAAAVRGWSVVAVYADEAISGAKGRDSRPGLDLALKDALRRRFDTLMVWGVDRLGRSLTDLVETMRELHGAKVDLFLLQQGVDTTTPAGKAMFQMMGVFAEFERELIVSRVRSGMERAKAEQAAGMKRTDAAGRRKQAIGRPKIPEAVAKAVSARLAAGDGIVRIAREQGIGVSVVQRLKRELAVDA